MIGIIMQIIVIATIAIFSDDIDLIRASIAVSLTSVLSNYMVSVFRSAIETENNFVSIKRCYDLIDLPSENNES